MEDIIKIISDNSTFIILGLLALMIILFITVIVLIRAVNRVEKKYKKMMRGTNADSLEALINNKINSIDESLQNSEEALSKYSELREEMKKCVNRVSIIRYKAFENIGSDLSFSIAILDDYNNGVIITNIYSRSDSTTYAKPVENGTSKYHLSEEEQYVLNEAMNK